MKVKVKTKSEYTYYELKKLIQNIDELGVTVHHEVLKIIENNKVPYTRNNNGVFIHLSYVNDNVITEIMDFITFCISHNQKLNQYDNHINICKYKLDMGKQESMENSAINSQSDKVNISCIENVDKPDEEDIAINKELVSKWDHSAECNTKFSQMKKRYSKRKGMLTMLDDGGKLDKCIDFLMNVES